MTLPHQKLRSCSRTGEDYVVGWTLKSWYIRPDSVKEKRHYKLDPQESDVSFNIDTY